jgi:hypothetical protein
MAVTEYLERARECAAMAEHMKPNDRKAMLDIADEWLKLADAATKVASSRQWRHGGSVEGQRE